MKKITLLFVITFLTFNLFVSSQTIQKADSISSVEKAKYLKEDLAKLLSKNINYPLDALKNNIDGDVVFSFIINKNGEVDSLTMRSSPDVILSSSALVALNLLDKKWSPAKINYVPIDKKYLIVFRYRMYLNTQPSDYKHDALGYLNKQKYDKALKIYNKAIKDNQYDFELLELRSQIKGLLGDVEGSKQDLQTSTRLHNDIMSVINVLARGETRVSTRVIKATSTRVIN